MPKSGTAVRADNRSFRIERGNRVVLAQELTQDPEKVRKGWWMASFRESGPDGEYVTRMQAQGFRPDLMDAATAWVEAPRPGDFRLAEEAMRR